AHAFSSNKSLFPPGGGEYQVWQGFGSRRTSPSTAPSVASRNSVRKLGYSRSSASGNTTRSPACDGRRRPWRRASAPFDVPHAIQWRDDAPLTDRRVRGRTPEVTWIDGGLLLLLALFGLRGFGRGFRREALGLAGLVIAGLLLVRWAEPLASLLVSRAGFGLLAARLVSAVGLALAVFLAVRLIGLLIARLTAALFLRPIDRVAGIGL